MVDIISALQTSIDIVGKLRALSKKVEEAEFKMLLADLSSELGDAKLEAANLKIDLATEREKNAALSGKLAERQSGNPIMSDSCYGFEGEEGLFCTSCFDVNSRRVRVKALTGAFKAFGKWECPSCKAHYG